MQATEYTRQQAQQIANDRQKPVRLYRNVFGWDVTYSSTPTDCTPTGKDRLFPRTHTFKPA